MTPLIWAIALLALGLLLVVLEVFLPTGGVLGVLAALCLIGSLSVSFSSSMQEGLLILFLTFTLTPLTVVGGLKLFPYTPMGRAILNQYAMENDPLPEDQRKGLIGRVGLAKSKMLPSGAIAIDGKTYNAVTSGMAVDAGQAVRVVRISGNSIIVQPHEGPIDPDEASPETVMEQPIEQLGLDPFADDSP